ncbi:MAG: hypothetical protein IPK16_03960 [Anaerolineales bacterium]|nr:hypothetical protein [Anaerolineales bacterium]
MTNGLSYFADWRDILLAVGGALSIILLMIWWRQQTTHWFRVLVLTFLLAFALDFASIYLFEVPPYYAGCSTGCAGWRGYPLPVARITVTGQTQVGIADFGLNLILLWLLVVVAALLGRVVGLAIDWENRSRRARLLTLGLLFLIPWSLLPRFWSRHSPPPPVKNYGWSITRAGRRNRPIASRDSGCNGLPWRMCANSVPIRC